MELSLVYNLTTLSDCCDSGAVPKNTYFYAPAAGMDYSKHFISTENALIIMNHYPLASLQNNWTSHEVTIMVSLSPPGWNRFGADASLQWHRTWREAVIGNSSKVLKKVGFT